MVTQLMLEEGERTCPNCDGAAEREEYGWMITCSNCEGNGYLSEKTNPRVIDLEQQRRWKEWAERDRRFIAAMYKRGCVQRGVWYRQALGPGYYCTYLPSGPMIVLSN